MNDTLDDQALRELAAEKQIHDANVKHLPSGSQELRDEHTRHSDRVAEIVDASLRRRSNPVT